MKNIMVVECMSTGKNFIQDIIDRNYNPIVLQTKASDDSIETRRYMAEIERAREFIDNEFDLIHEKDSYDETLEMVRKFDPVLVIPGSEKGVILATRLANDLGLLCNPIENIDAMTLKDKMHERLAENNLRSIRGKVVKSVEEAIDFYDSEGLGKVVVKPVYSAGSVGMRLCNDKEEMVIAINEVFTMKGMYGNDLEELLIQEQIEGQEYIVNTVSHDGVHRVTSMLKYKKEKTSEGGNIYDYIEFIGEIDIGETDLIEYAYDVADAMGIRYGPVHGEYMIDDDGPVLIEVNCRPMGGSQDAEYLNMILGHHETDCILDSYLNPEKFYSDSRKGYKTFAHACFKQFIVPKDIIARSAPIEKIGLNLKSHYKTVMNFTEESPFVAKTQDFETAGGNIFLINKDFQQITKDLEFLRRVEKRAFQLILSEEKSQEIRVDEAEVHQNIKTLSQRIKVHGTALLITESVFDDINIPQVTADGMDEIKGEFDCVIVNLNESIHNKGTEDVTRTFLKAFNKIKVGGLVFIPNTTYEYVPDGRLGVEALVKLVDFDLEMPIHKFTRMVVASKREKHSIAID